MKKFSRMEANKIVRQVLNRNGVDLCYTQYSVAGHDIRLTGYLCHTDGSIHHANQIETMIQEFQRFLPGYTVSGDFDNWNFTQDHITNIGGMQQQETEEETEEGTTDYEEVG